MKRYIKNLILINILGNMIKLTVHVEINLQMYIQMMKIKIFPIMIEIFKNILNFLDINLTDTLNVINYLINLI